MSESDTERKKVVNECLGESIVLVTLTICGCIVVWFLATKLEIIPKKKGKKYEAIVSRNKKLVAGIVACFLCVIISGNILVKSIRGSEPVIEEKEYTKVLKYSLQEGNVVCEYTEEDLYVREGKLYKAKTENGQTIFEEFTLSENKGLTIYTAVSESDTKKGN